MSDFDFDARGVQPSQPMSAVPIGWYQAMIESDRVIPTKANDGSQQLEQTFVLLAGADGNPQFKGRKILNRLQLWNKTPKACEIAGEELSAQCHVTGQLVLTTATGGTRALWNKPIQINVSLDDTGKWNEIVGYKDMQGNDPGRQGSGQQQQPAAPPQAPAPAPQQQPAAPQFAPPQQQAPAAVQFAPPGQPPQFQQPAPQQQPQQAAPGGWAPPQQSQAPAPAAPGNWGPPAAPGGTPFPGGAPAPAAPQAPAPAAWAPQGAPGAPAGVAPWGAPR